MHAPPSSTELANLPYRGSAQSMLDLMQGRIELSVSTIPPTLQHIREGKLRAYAIMSEKRNAMLGEVLTVAEAGVPGCEAGLWTALVAPAGVPPDIAKRLTETMLAIVGAEDVQKALRAQGVDPEPGAPQVVATQIQNDLAKWREVVATAKISGAK